MTKFKKRIHELLDLGYKWRQAYAIAKKEEHKGKRRKHLMKRR